MPDWPHQSAGLQNFKEKVVIKAVKLKGSSMKPVYKEGEFVFCETDFDPASLKPGDCAVYEMDGGLYLHEIKEKTEDGFYFGNSDDLPQHFVSFRQIKYIPAEKRAAVPFAGSVFYPLRALKNFLIKR